MHLKKPYILVELRLSQIFLSTLLFLHCLANADNEELKSSDMFGDNSYIVRSTNHYNGTYLDMIVGYYFKKNKRISRNKHFMIFKLSDKQFNFYDLTSSIPTKDFFRGYLFREYNSSGITYRLDGKYNNFTGGLASKNGYAGAPKPLSLNVQPNENSVQYAFSVAYKKEAKEIYDYKKNLFKGNRLLMRVSLFKTSELQYYVGSLGEYMTFVFDDLLDVNIPLN